LKEREYFLDTFFYPKSVAIVGATGNEMKMNYHITENLLRLKFLGKIYLVNPNSKEILGIKTYPRLNDIPDDIDLVVSAVPYNQTLKIIKDCVELGIKRVVIIAGGFDEAGEKGRELYNDVKRITGEEKIRVLGPNTLSPINTSNNLIISFHPVKKLNKGGLSFVFQSGLYEYKLNWIFSHLGIAKILDLGNKMDINEVDALEYLVDDPETEVIAMHIESIKGDGRRFIQILRERSKEKPIIILKSGRTKAGSMAVASHTGTIAQENDPILDTILRQVGAIRAQNIDEFFDFAKIFDFIKEMPKSDRISIVNLSGGEGVIATDACERNGLKMAKLGEKTYRKLKEIFPLWEIPLNPLDAGVCMEFHLTDFASNIYSFFEHLTSVLDDEGVDCMIMQIPTTIFIKMAYSQFPKSIILELMNTVADIFLRIKEKGKPLVLWRSSMDPLEDEFVSILESRKVPVYPSSERAVKAVSVLCKYKDEGL